MHYFLIAGEASGDLHASQLMQQLAAADPQARFTFLGGDLMADVAGHAPLIHYREMAYMGFSEVLRNLGKVRKNLATARKAVVDSKPDALILIDYPSFNLKVAETAAKASIPTYYYISPKIWAWKQWRVKAIRRLMRRVLCILPFEPDFYRAHDYDQATYVGNPSVEEIERALAATPSREEFAANHGLRANRPFIALLPGSRRGEIRCNLPVMDAVARQFPGYTIVVAGAPAIDDSVYNGLTKFKIVRSATHELLAHAHAALVTSGTATLEAALAGVPQVVMYRSNGSKLAYNLMKRLLKVRFVSLPNLIADREIIPEMLLHFCTPQAVTERLQQLTPNNSPARAAQLEGYRQMRDILGPAGASERAASLIINDLRNEK